MLLEENSMLFSSSSWYSLKFRCSWLQNFHSLVTFSYFLTCSPLFILFTFTVSFHRNVIILLFWSKYCIILKPFPLRIIPFLHQRFPCSWIVAHDLNQSFSNCVSWNPAVLCELGRRVLWEIKDNNKKSSLACGRFFFNHQRFASWSRFPEYMFFF